MNNPLRIIIQEGDDDFRKQIEEETRADAKYALLCSFKSFYSLVDVAHLFNADVVLLNWHYPTQKIFDFILSAKKNNPLIRILVTFDFVQPDFIFKTMRGGADGFLIKPFSVGDVLNVSVKEADKKLHYHLNVLQRSAYGHLAAASGR